MSRLRFTISMSLDGFVAGPRQSLKDPLGIGGEQLHEWVVGLAAWREAHGLPGGAVNESTRVIDESLINIGATIMGPQLARRYITFFPKTRALSHSCAALPCRTTRPAG